MWYMRTYLFLGYLVIVGCKPTEIKQESGPCVGMDCLHGVLMHGDETEGEKHAAEDGYIQHKDDLATGGGKQGPEDPDEYFHGLMHEGEDGASKGHHEGPAGPQKQDEGKPAPEDPQEYFHGVLMHGDDDTGGSHGHEDPEQVVKMEKPQNPQDLDDYYHGVLMHGDAEPGIRHHDDEPISDQDPPPDTPAKMKPLSGDDMMHGVLMHGDEDGEVEHPHENDTGGRESGDEGKKIKPLSGDDMMHGVLMHGDEESGAEHHHENENQTSNETAKMKPLSGDDFMHGVLMHGEEGGESVHAEDSSEDEEYAKTHPKNVKIGPDPDSLHGLLMHGDEEHGVDHSDEDLKLGAVEGPGVEASVSDPESVLHPEGNHVHVDPKDIDLNKINGRDKEDFENWKKQERKTPEEEQKDLESDWRQTLGYITDAFLSDIEMMKRRYLPRFNWPVAEEEVGSEDLGAERLKLDAVDSEEDIRHELHLIGDTGPIGETRHEHDETER